MGFNKVSRDSRVSMVRVGVSISVMIRVSLVLVIGWDRTFRRGVSKVIRWVPDV